jgi:hypothetical protein
MSETNQGLMQRKVLQDDATLDTADTGMEEGMTTGNYDLVVGVTTSPANTITPQEDRQRLEQQIRDEVLQSVATSVRPNHKMRKISLLAALLITVGIVLGVVVGKSSKDCFPVAGVVVDNNSKDPSTTTPRPVDIVPISAGNGATDMSPGICTLCDDGQDPLTDPTTVFFPNSGFDCNGLIDDLATKGGDWAANDAECKDMQLLAFQIGCCQWPPFQYCTICENDEPFASDNEVPLGTTDK